MSLSHLDSRKLLVLFTIFTHVRQTSIYPLYSPTSFQKETTNEIFDKSLYDEVTHRSVLSYHKVFAANLLSGSGQEWVEWVKVREVAWQ